MLSWSGPIIVALCVDGVGDGGEQGSKSVVAIPPVVDAVELRLPVQLPPPLGPEKSLRYPDADRAFA